MQKDQHSETFSEWLRKQRRDLNLDQKSFAEKAGLSQAAVCNVEVGRAPYNPRRLRHITYAKILEALGIPDTDREEVVARFFPQTYNPKAFQHAEIISGRVLHISLGTRIDALIAESGLSDANQQALGELLISQTLLFSRALGHRGNKKF